MASWEASLDIDTRKHLRRRNPSFPLQPSHRLCKAAIPMQRAHEAPPSTQPTHHGNHCSRNCWPWASPKTRLKRMPTLSNCTLSSASRRRNSKRKTSANPELLRRPRPVHLPQLPLSAPKTQAARDAGLHQHPRQRDARDTMPQSTGTPRGALRRRHLHEKLHPHQDRPSPSSERLRPWQKQASLRISLPHHQAGREPRPTQQTQALHHLLVRRRRLCPTSQLEASLACLHLSQATACPRGHRLLPQAEGQYHRRLQHETSRQHLLHHFLQSPQQRRHHRLFTTSRLLRYHHPHLDLHHLHLQEQHQFRLLCPLHRM